MVREKGNQMVREERLRAVKRDGTMVLGRREFQVTIQITDCCH